MMRRRGGPGVMSTMARTAVVAGTATATANAVNARGAAKAQARQQAAQEQAAQQAAQIQQQLAAQEAAIATADIGSKIEKLKDLGQLKDAGVLTEEEFAQAKATVLGG